MCTPYCPSISKFLFHLCILLSQFTILCLFVLVSVCAFSVNLLVMSHVSCTTNIIFSSIQHRKSSLMFASENGDSEVVKILLSAGANVDLQDKVSIISSSPHLPHPIPAYFTSCAHLSAPPLYLCSCIKFSSISVRRAC